MVSCFLRFRSFIGFEVSWESWIHRPGIWQPYLCSWQQGRTIFWSIDVRVYFTKNSVILFPLRL